MGRRDAPRCGIRAPRRRPNVAAEFADHEPFEQLRLNPSTRSSPSGSPRLAAVVLARLVQLRERRCLVDGDYAMKNMLIAPGRRWKLDFEVAQNGNPVFDIGFFLSFAVLSAIRWPGLSAEMRDRRVPVSRAGTRRVRRRRAARRPRGPDRAHGLPSARAHRRQVAGRVSRSAVGVGRGARGGPRVAAHAGAGAVELALLSVAGEAGEVAQRLLRLRRLLTREVDAAGR